MADVKKIATRDSYGEALAQFGAVYENLIVLDADLSKFNQNSDISEEVSTASYQLWNCRMQHDVRCGRACINR